MRVERISARVLPLTVTGIAAYMALIVVRGVWEWVA